MSRKIWVRVLLVSASLSAVLAATACGPGLPSAIGPPIGSILQGLTSSVDNVVANATTGAESDILAASGSVDSAISNAASAYAQDLNLSLNQVNNTVASSIAQLQNLVSSLQTTVTQTLQTTTNDAQQLINEIPFSDKNPQVTSYSPRFVEHGRQATIEVTVNGNFVYAAQAHLTPTLKVGRTTIKPNENTTPQLGFAVPTSLLPAAGTGLSTISLHLTAPYQHGLVFHSTALDSFSLLITVLPANPVRSMTLYTKQQGEVTRTIVQPPGAPAAGGWYLESYSTCQAQSFTTSFNADPGWTIIPSTVSAGIIYNKNPGNAQVTAIGKTDSAQINANTEPGNPCVCTPLFGCSSSGSGDVSFYLTYAEEQPTSNDVSTPVPISWGDTISEPVSPGWTLKAILFDGHELDFNNSDSSDPFLHVVNNGQNITISAQYTNLVY